MFNLGIINDDLFLSTNVRFKKKFSNNELNLYHYFYNKTKYYPENVIVIKNFIFFFVRKQDYFKVKFALNLIRKELVKKIIIIGTEESLIKVLFNLFPDLYIHDIKVEWDLYSNERIVYIYFLSYEDRGVAVGRHGDYIKAINEIFKKHIKFDIKLENAEVPIKIKCELIQI